jgi:hypothetical protein
MAQLLLDAGDSQTMMSQVDLRGNTALHLAVGSGKPEITALLLERGADMLSTNSDGHSVLDVAMEFWIPDPSRIEVGKRNVQLLLDQGIPIPRSLGPTILSLGAYFGSPLICHQVVKFDGQLAQVVDRHGWTPLMLALQNRHHEVARILFPFDKANKSDSLVTNRGGEYGHRPSGWEQSPTELKTSDNLELELRDDCRIKTVAPQLSNHPIPFGVSRFYWELRLVEGRKTTVGIGVSDESQPSRFCHATWYYEPRRMWVYRQHGRVKGRVRDWTRSKMFRVPGPKYSQGDTVGCGVDFVKGVIFFTKNGVLLGKRISRVHRSYSTPCTVVSLTQAVQAMSSTSSLTAGCSPLS